jgi:hypothetical protein
MAAVVPDVYGILENKWTELGATADITKRTLSLGAPDAITGWYAKTFAESTVQGFIIPKGLNSFLLMPGIYVRYDAICITKTAFIQRDEVTDAAGNVYVVESFKKHRFLDTFAFYELQLTLKTVMTGVPSKWDGEEDFFNKLKNQFESNGLSADLTLFTLTLNSQETITGWYLPSYTESTIEGVLLPQNPATVYDRAGMRTKYVSLLYTLAEVFEGDRVNDASKVQYVITSRTMLFLANKLVFYKCDVEALFFGVASGAFIEEDFEDLDDWETGGGGCGGGPDIETNPAEAYSGNTYVAVPYTGYIAQSAIGWGIQMTSGLFTKWSIEVKMRAGVGAGTVSFRIEYADGTDSGEIVVACNDATYTLVDLKAHLTIGKNVDYVRIWSNNLADLLLDWYELHYIGDVPSGFPGL